MATAGSIVVDLLLRTGSFSTDLKRAQKEMKQLEKQINDTGKKIGTAIGAGVAIATTALVGVTAQAIDYADRLDELSARLGLSTEKLSGWGYAAKITGIDLETLASAIPKLSKNLAEALDPTSKQAKLFEALGVSVKDGVGKLRDVEDVLPELADKFKALDDDTLEAALAMELFGKSGAEMLEFLNKGSDGIADLEDKASSLGVVVSQQTAAAAGEFKDELGDVKEIATALGLQLAERLLPQMIELVDKFQMVVQDGSAAEKIVSAINFALEDTSTSFDKFNHLLQTASDLFGSVRDNAQGTLEVIAGITQLDWGSFRQGLQTMADARERFARGFMSFDEYQENQNRKPTGQVPTYLDLPGYLSGANSTFSPVGYFPAFDSSKSPPPDPKGLRDFFGGNGSKKPRASGKSDAERELERLAQAYEQVESRLKEEIDLFGKTGEAAQLSYDLKFGALAKLTPAQKEYLLGLAKEADLQRDLKEMEEAAEKEGKQMSERYLATIGGLQEELELRKISNVEREKEIARRLAGAEAASIEADAIGRVVEELHRQDKVISAMDNLRDSAADALTNIALDFDNALEHAKDFFDNLAAMITRAIAEQWIEKLLGSKRQEGGGGIGSSIGGLLGGIFNFGGAKAGGGDVWPNSAFLVGEEGPEMFVPRTAGVILPADLTAERRGGTARMIQQTFNQVINGPMTRRTAEQAARETGRSARRGLARTG